MAIWQKFPSRDRSDTPKVSKSHLVHSLLSDLPVHFRLLNRLWSLQVDSRPAHRQRQHDRHRSRGDAQDEHPLDRHDDGLEHPLLHRRIQRPQKRAPDPRDRGLHVRLGDARDQGGDGVLREVEEDAVGDGEGDGDAGDLRARDEADGQGDFLGRDEPLGDGEGRVDEEAGAQPAEDERGVDVGRADGEGDVEEHGVADDDEEAPGEEPGEVVLEFFHEGAVEQRGEDEGNDVGEQADAGTEGLVRLHELEVEGNEVDGDEGVGGGGGDLGEEDCHFFLGDVVDGEDTAGERRQDGEGLLEAKEDEEHAGEDEERDYGCTVPVVENAAEGDGHDARDEGADLEEGAKVVNFAAAGQEGGAGAGIA